MRGSPTVFSWKMSSGCSGRRVCADTETVATATAANRIRFIVALLVVFGRCLRSLLALRVVGVGGRRLLPARRGAAHRRLLRAAPPLRGRRRRQQPRHARAARLLLG